MWGHPGIGRYIRELASALCETGPSELLTLLLPPEATSIPRGPRIRRSAAGIYGVREQIELPFLTRPFDLLHVPHFNIPLAYSGKMIVTVHDLLYLHDAKSSRFGLGRFYAELFFRAIRRKAALVIAVSYYTKTDLCRRFPKLQSDRVVVVHEAASPRFQPIHDKERLDAARARHLLHRPFVLFVGSLKRHKNVALLIEAMARLKQKKEFPHELVLVGKPDTRYTEPQRLIARHSFVRHLGCLPDEELVNLYNLAELFVLPSLHEGFGLPVLEAMACGTPVAAADGTSLPEILGDAGALFDPARVDALEDVLYNVLTNRERREEMSKKGIDRAAQFSWQKTASRTWDLYRRALG